MKNRLCHPAGRAAGLFRAILGYPGLCWMCPNPPSRAKALPVRCGPGPSRAGLGGLGGASGSGAAGAAPAVSRCSLQNPEVPSIGCPQVVASGAVGCPCPCFPLAKMERHVASALSLPVLPAFLTYGLSSSACCVPLKYH